jgi:endonuclease YncB( thermonuclease family)
MAARWGVCARTRSHAFLNDEKPVKCWLLIIVEEKNEQKAKAYFVRF